MAKRKGIRVWLITWDWMGDHAKPKKKIAAILNPRWSPDKVREYIEFIYANSEYSFSERIAYANNRKFNPYPAEFMRIKGIKWTGQITCGDNPWLFARKVDNLLVVGDTDDEDSVVWDEIPKPDFDKLNRIIHAKES